MTEPFALTDSLLTDAYVLHHYPETSSTMDAIVPLLYQEAVNPIPVVYADKQTQGRGRIKGRSWKTNIGNVICSYALSKAHVPQPVTGLSLVTGLALLSTLKSLGVQRSMTLKWPNDLFVDNKKVAGILIESTTHHYVIGIGVNVTWNPDGVDAPYESTRIGDEIVGDRMHVIDGVIRKTVALIHQWQTKGFQWVIDSWLPYGAYLNQDVYLVNQTHTEEGTSAGNNTVVTGRFVGLDTHGGIRIVTQAGERIFYAGDVSLRPL